MSIPVRIFISYARADLEHLEALEKQLSALKAQGQIEVWTDQGLLPGETWEPSLLDALHTAEIVLLLVSPDFMASRFIHDVELPKSFERRRLGQVRIVPVMVRPTDIGGSALAELQGLPRDFQPVTEWQNRDHAWLEVVMGLRQVLAQPHRPEHVPQHLRSGYTPLPEVYPPSALLMARYRVVPFFQSIRAQELERIRGWLARPASFSVLLITGEAGSGKTRLLWEVAEQQREVGWQAGTLDVRQSLTDMKQGLRDVLAVPHPTLIAIDYAESVSELGALLEHLYTQASARKAPLRVLLTARGSGDWWQLLQERVTPELTWSLKASTPLELSDKPNERTPEALTDLFQAGLEQLAKLRKRKTPVASFDLTDPRADRPLFCLLAALATVEGLSFQGETLLEALVHHERQFWRNLLPGDELAAEAVQGFLLRLLAAVTLRGGLRARGEAERLRVALECPSSLGTEKLWPFLQRVYPGLASEHVRPVEPDLLGAELVRQALKGDPPRKLLEAAVSDNDAAALATAFRILEELGQSDSALGQSALEALLARELEARALPALQAATAWRGHARVHVIAEVLLARLKAGAPTEVLEQVTDALPEQSLALATLAEWVTEALLGSTQDQASPKRAALLNNLGNRLSDLGQREQALAATEEAVALRRGLAAKSPDAFLPDLAMSLNNLGNRLSDLGQREQALAATEEAVALRRGLAAKSPDAFLPDLATSLNNLGIWLSALGRREQALAATEEAVALRRGLAEKSPDAFLPDLAMSLNNLGALLSALGQREQALAATEEAVALRRGLAEKSPDAFLPYLAQSLNNLGNNLSALGQREQALAATKEAVALRRGLAEKSPDAFLPGLAMSLNNLGNWLSALGQREQALAATQEAVAQYRGLAAKSPDAFLPDLAGSLNNLGALLSALGQREQALAATEEAVAQYRGLAAKSPDAFLPDLAGSLNNLGSSLSDLGRWEQALAATEEAVTLRRGLAEKSPDAFRPYLAGSLNNLGALLSALGQREQALAATEEAVAQYRGLAEKSPDAFLPDLAMSLNNLGNRLSALGQREQALAATEEAVAQYRGLAEKSPDAFLPDLAMSLNNLGNSLSDLGRWEQALAATEEAVALRRGLAAKSPDAFLPDLAGSLNNLGVRLSALGRREQALAATEEAVALRRGLAEKSPDAFLPYLAQSLNNLGALLSALGQREQALAATEEAVAQYRGLAEKSPDAFLPYLAQGLNNLGAQLSALGQREQALAAARESARLFTLLFLELPQAFGSDWITSLRNLHLRCQEAGVDPASDPELAELLTLLQQVEQGLATQDS